LKSPANPGCRSIVVVFFFLFVVIIIILAGRCARGVGRSAGTGRIATDACIRGRSERERIQ